MEVSLPNNSPWGPPQLRVSVPLSISTIPELVTSVPLIADSKTAGRATLLRSINQATLHRRCVDCCQQAFTLYSAFKWIDKTTGVDACSADRLAAFSLLVDQTTRIKLLIRTILLFPPVLTSLSPILFLGKSAVPFLPLAMSIALHACPCLTFTSQLKF